VATLPSHITQKLREDQPNRATWSDDLVALTDPKIEARPLQLPQVGQICPKNREYDYYWVRLKRGSNPDHTRFNQLRAAGYTKATIDDVDPLVNSVTASADGQEITCGIDLILMKAHPQVHRGALKYHFQRAIGMTNPRGKEANDAIMKSGAYSSQDDAALRASNTSAITTDAELDARRADPGAENALQVGSPKWDKIANEAKQKK
jgi:hypothetical protein